MLDILYLLFRPTVTYIPQVSLSGWEKVSPWSVPARERLRAVLLAPWFDVYRALAAGGGGYDYLPALRRKYGMTTVSMHRANNDMAKTYDFMVVDKPADNRRAIIIVSRDVIPDAIVAATISSVLILLDRLGYSIDIKDHPNPDFRLGLTYPGARIIDATLPVEMMLPHYSVIVGVASTSLARTSATHQRVISVLRLLPESFAKDLSSRLAHLAPLAGHIVFPTDFEALERLLVPEKCVDSSSDIVP